MGENYTRLSPRQKMINMMYIVLTAMLALNVSSDVLDGFSKVEEGLNRSNINADSRNVRILNQLQAFAEQNPDKGRVWAERAEAVRDSTMALFNLADEMKTAIVRHADGAKGDVHDIRHPDNLEAASVVMLTDGAGRGRYLRERVDSYRNFINSFISDPAKAITIDEALSTEPVSVAGMIAPKNWEEAKFDSQPVVAAVTLLSQLQNDILFAEGEALASLLSQVDAGDVRVNELHAFVIPQSKLVMRGSKYSADIVLAAIDTTARPQVYVSGKPLDSQTFEQTASSTGAFTYEGYLEVPGADGAPMRHKFAGEYTVIEPSATVSATMMNVLYAGIDNPLSISVPGVATKDINATMTNGTLTRKGDSWIARPAAVGSDAVVTVTAMMDGRNAQVAQIAFRVRRLPDPTPYIAISDSKGGEERYKGGKPISKSILAAAEGLDAAIDDGLLDTRFQVVSFETVSFDSMGNAMPELSDGAKFSRRQKQMIRSLQRGKRFFISRIRATGPDGITRDLSPMEVIVN